MNCQIVNMPADCPQNLDEVSIALEVCSEPRTMNQDAASAAMPMPGKYSYIHKVTLIISNRDPKKFSRSNVKIVSLLLLAIVCRNNFNQYTSQTFSIDTPSVTNYIFQVLL